MQFNWAIYSVSNGHFLSSIKSHGLPFTICLACDTTKAGRSLFNEFAPDANVFSSGNDLLNHIRASGEQSIISGYLINSYRFEQVRSLHRSGNYNSRSSRSYASYGRCQLSWPSSFLTTMERRQVFHKRLRSCSLESVFAGNFLSRYR